MIRKILTGLLLIEIIAVSAYAQTQNYSISHYTSKDGLANNEALDILQDKNGFIWITTVNGFSRYDGFEFVNFYSTENDSNTLTSNSCSRLVEDTSGYLWISTWNGLNRMDPKTQIIKRFYHVIPAFTGKGSSAGDISIDRFGNLFYCGQSVIMKWNYTQQKFESFYPEIFNAYKDSLGDLFGIYHDSGDRYWVRYRRGFRLLDVDSKKLISISKEMDQLQIIHIEEDINKDLILATWGRQLARFNPETRAVEFILSKDTSFKNNLIMQSCMITKTGNQDKLWFTIDDFGIGVFDRSSNSAQKIAFENILVNEKNTPVISKVFADRQHNIWCTSAYGVYKIINRPPDITNYTFNFLKQAGHVAQITRQEHYNADALLIRTEDNRFCHFNLTTMQAGWITEINARNGKLPLKDVYYHSYDRFNRLWIFTVTNDIICYDKNADTLFHTQFDPGKDINGVQKLFYAAHTDKNNKTWLCSNGGLFYLENGKVKRFEFKNETERYHSTFSTSIRTIVEDDHGHLWMMKHYSWEGGKACITRINLKDESFENYFSDGNPGSIIADQDFFDMTMDHYGTLWICGINGLITCSTGDAKPFFSSVKQQYPFNYGLTTRSLLFNDTLVVLARGGIVLVNVKDGNVIRRYDEKDGLFMLGNLYSFHKLSNSRLLLNYGNNYQVINLGISKPVDDLQEPILTGIKIKEDDFIEYKNSNQSAPFVNEIVMRAGMHDIILKFSAIDFSENINNQFTYFLEGFENKWSAPVSSNQVSYNNLVPGEYLFRLKAINREGYEGNELQVPVIVKPFYYQTLWFKFLIVLLTGISVYYVFRYRLKTKLEQQLALQKERERISSDLHDDLGSGLTSIVMMSERIKKKTNGAGHDIEMEKISGTANVLVDNMREIVWALNTENDSLENLVGYIHEHAQKAFEFSPINLKVEIPDKIAEAQLAAEPRRNIFLTVKETLNNAIRYSEAQNVFMKFRTSAEAVEIEISDDGKGFSIDGIGKRANGLKNMKKRMNIIKGSYAVESSPGNGTATEIRFNLK